MYILRTERAIMPHYHGLRAMIIYQAAYLSICIRRGVVSSIPRTGGGLMLFSPETRFDPGKYERPL